MKAIKLTVFLAICSVFVFCRRNGNHSEFERQLQVSKSDTLSYDERSKVCKQILHNVNLINNDSIRREVFNSVGWSYIGIKDWESAKKVFKMLEDCSGSSKVHLAAAYRGFGKILENQSSNDSAYFWYDKALNLYTKSKDKLGECVVLQDKASIKYFCNDYTGSEVCLIDALKIAKKINDPVQIFEIYSFLGINSNEQGDFSYAKYYYFRATKALRYNFKNYDLQYAQILFLRGYNEYSQKRFTEAIKLYQQSIRIRERENKRDDLYYQVVDNLAHIQLLQGNYNQAKMNLLFTARSRDSLKILQGKNFNKLYLSQYYQATKNIPLAIQYGKEALALSKEFKAPNDVLKCLKYLAELDKFNALNYTKQYIRLSDSIQRRERETRNKFAKIEYETEELLREKELSAERKSLFLTMALLASSACLLAGVIYALKSRQQEMEYFQRQQKAKEEIFSLIQEGHSKMESGRNIEKKRIARELHDGVMNKLASTRFNLYRLKDNSNVETIRKCITYIDHLQEIEQEIRNVAYDLNKEVFTEKETFDRALVGLLDQYIEGNVAEVKQHINKDINWDEVQNGIKIDIYRILQESLQNIKKYARAFRVSIILDVRDRSLFLEVADDGVGFEFSEIEAGLGLTNIQARAKENAGSAQIISQKSKGTIIRVIFPDYKT